MEAPQCSAESDNKEKAMLPVLHEDIRNQDDPTDFAINVRGESFPVHKIILTTHSEYFRAMLAHDTKEKQQGFVDMKEVSPDGVRECVEFMYSGKVNVEDLTVEDILQVADMMQLAKVNEICTEVINEILKSGNCVSIYKLATKYRFIELQEKAQNYFENNSDIEIIELLQLTKDGFIIFLGTSSLCNELAWDCIINWIKHDLELRKEFVLGLVKLLDWDQFSSPLLLRRLWAESIFRNCSMCRELVFESLFFDLEVFESNLSVETYFILKTISDQFKHVIKQIKNMLFQFFKRQIILLSTKPDFKSVDSAEILSLFENEKSDILAPETWWWHTALTCVKHSPDRKNIFTKLMRTIRFDELPNQFLRSVVANEPLVKNVDECFKMFVNALTQPSRNYATKASVVVLYSNGSIRALNLRTKTWTNFRSFENLLPNGKLCLINGAKLFYLQGNEWLEKRSMASDFTGSKEITVLEDCVYVICANRLLFCYNSSKDSWNEVTLPTEIKHINSVASIAGCVYFFENGKVNIFNVAKQGWSVRSLEGFSWISIGINGEIYVCRSNKSDPNLEFSKLEDISIPKLPEISSSISRKTADFIFGSSARSTNSSGFGSATSHSANSHTDTVSTRPAELHSLLNINETLAVVINNKMYIHDDICDNRNFFADIPKLCGGTQGNEITIDMISVCVFYEETI